MYYCDIFTAIRADGKIPPVFSKEKGGYTVLHQSIEDRISIINQILREGYDSFPASANFNHESERVKFYMSIRDRRTLIRQLAKTLYTHDTELSPEELSSNHLSTAEKIRDEINYLLIENPFSNQHHNVRCALKRVLEAEHDLFLSLSIPKTDISTLKIIDCGYTTYAKDFKYLRDLLVCHIDKLVTDYEARLV